MAVHLDHCQDVPEIVGNTACHGSDGLHLLGMPQLVFQHFSLRGIAKHHKHTGRFSLVIIETGTTDIDIDQVPILRESSCFKIRDGFALVDNLLNTRHGGIPFGFRQKGNLFSSDFLRGPAKDIRE